MSKYGSHTYTAKYTITNFVAETTDAQMIYWTLIPYDFSNSIGKAYIKIHTDFTIQDTIDVWGYGNYGGTAYVYDGLIEMQSDGNLDTDEYMTILVKFPLGTFNTTNRLNNNFKYYYNIAEEGSTKYNGNGSDKIGMAKAGVLIGLSLLGMIASFICFGIVFICIVIVIARSACWDKISYGELGKKIPKDVPYFRDIPCNEDVFRAYYIAYQYNLMKNKTDLLGAIILKWLKDDMIKIKQKNEGLIFKKENTCIVLNETNPQIIVEPKERELFQMLYEASKDGYLESNEFEKWCEKSYSKILSWFDEIIKIEEKKLINEGLLNVKQKMFMGNISEATPELKREALELAGLKRYLNEYTLIKEREALEVQLFEKYLIFAQIMGIANKVAKEFKKIYPEIIEQSNYTSYDNIVSSNKGIISARSAEARAQSYSSGGGGFSSGSGGGGSFGGGGGGRRL